MALPTDANIDFLLCDKVRQNPDGKLDLAGYFPVPEINIDPAARLPGEVHLSFVFVIRDGEGQFDSTFRIADPLGRELHRYNAKFEKLPRFPYVMMLQVSRIPIASLGNYEVSLEIEGQFYRRSIRVHQ